MKTNEEFINECIELAKLGEGLVSPNPLVGAIVVNKNGKVVGKGFHKKYGEAHAEINALNEAGEKAKGGTLYINLEPCCHFGKTPPCIDRVINAGIKKIVIGMEDPNPKVSGNGIKKALNAGIEVVLGVQEKKCKKLNEIFITNILRHKPFVAIKTASTIDGKIATSTGNSKWITAENSRNIVHQLRNKYDAVLTGSGTVIKDNPSLTARINNTRNPVRIIIDSNLITSPDSKVYCNDKTRVIIVVSAEISSEKIQKYPDNVEFIKCPVLNNGKIDLNYLTRALFENNINSVLVEAGGKLNAELIKNNIVDKFYFFIAPKILGDTNARQLFEGFYIENINECSIIKFENIQYLDPDILIEGYTSLSYPN